MNILPNKIIPRNKIKVIKKDTFIQNTVSFTESSLAVFENNTSLKASGISHAYSANAAPVEYNPIS